MQKLLLETKISLMQIVQTDNFLLTKPKARVLKINNQNNNFALKTK